MARLAWTGLILALFVSPAEATPLRGAQRSAKDPRTRLDPRWTTKPDGETYEFIGAGHHPMLLGKRRGRCFTADRQGGIVINCPGYNANHSVQRHGKYTHEGYDLAWRPGEVAALKNPFAGPATLTAEPTTRAWRLTGPNGEQITFGHVDLTRNVRKRGEPSGLDEIEIPSIRVGELYRRWRPVKLSPGEVFCTVQLEHYFHYPHLHIGQGWEHLGLPEQGAFRKGTQPAREPR